MAAVTRPGASPPAAASPSPQPGRGRVGLIVLAALITGLLVAAGLVAAPLITPTEVPLTGALLVGFAVGWALLALLSSRLSDQPQPWAVVPATVMAVLGALLLSDPPLAVRAALGWVWPPVLLGVVVGIALGIHRRLRSWLGRLLLVPVLAVLTLAAVGGGWQTVAESVDARRPMAGELVDVEGHRLHLRCTGSGSPTVVLEPGFAQVSAVLGWVEPVVAATSRVCVYDRAGRGRSDPTPHPLDGLRTAADLHTLLERAQVPGPYVLAGHSYGGLYSLIFAAGYPDQVAGLVLIDSTSPAARVTPPASALQGRLTALLPAAAHLGVARLYGLSSYESLPPAARDEARAGTATADYVRSVLDELAEGPTVVRQATALTDLGGRPLVVLTAGDDDPRWRLRQDRLAALSTNSSHRVLPDATHDSLLLDRRDAGAVSTAIRDVVVSVRTSVPVR